MEDLISRKALVKGLIEDYEQCMSFDGLLNYIHKQPTILEEGFELRILKNYLYHKPKTYHQRNQNWIIIRDLLMSGTSTAGMTSCVMKCHELGIDPYGYNLKDSE